MSRPQDFPRDAAVRGALGLTATPVTLPAEAYAEAIKSLSGALRAIHGHMIEARRGGDEWAAEFLVDDWPALVPEGIRTLLHLDDD